MALALAAGACGRGSEERGRRLYAEHGCAVCHGASGRGDGPSARRLDTPPRDFTDPRAYRRGSSREEIAASIRKGGGAMPAFTDVSESEAADIAAWIVSLQQQRAAGGGQP